MKMFILKPIKDLKNSPWEPWYDKMFGIIVNAENEDTARRIAQINSGEESDTKYIQLFYDGYGYYNTEKHFTTMPWVDSGKSTCEELKVGDNRGIIMIDKRCA